MDKELEKIKQIDKEIENGLDVEGLKKVRKKLYRFKDCLISNEAYILKHQILICIKDMVAEERERKSKNDELTKYKRAFEILKPIINIDNNIEEGGKEYWLSDIWGLRKLTKEQYELLEELMKSEN